MARLRCWSLTKLHCPARHPVACLLYSSTEEMVALEVNGCGGGNTPSPSKTILTAQAGAGDAGVRGGRAGQGPCGGLCRGRGSGGDVGGGPREGRGGQGRGGDVAGGGPPQQQQHPEGQQREGQGQGRWRVVEDCMGQRRKDGTGPGGGSGSGEVVLITSTSRG